MPADDPVRSSRTGELGSEGGGYGELTQAARAAHGDNTDPRPNESSLLTFAVIGIVILLVLLMIWFGSSLSESMTP